ncbi:MAG: CHAP domain-containing protein [Flavobacteriales bacterium]|nr:CHAP domain-containing protein [Flavobacteriales bacterium]
MQHLLLLTLFSSFWLAPNGISETPIDTWNNVHIYEGGDGTAHYSDSGYRYGLKWQCVEFVKRYYASHLDHEMPNTWGHAISFFDKSLEDGEWNKARGLVQYTNGSATSPAVDDLLILDWAEPYGHVAIVGEVTETQILVIQQNAGPTRIYLDLDRSDGKYTISDQVVGWLRKE